MTTGLDFSSEQGLLQQAPLPSSKPALPFANALILNSAANKTVFPNQFWRIAPGKRQTLSKPAPTHAAAFVHTHPLRGGDLDLTSSSQGWRVSQRASSSPSWVLEPLLSGSWAGAEPQAIRVKELLK